MFRIRISNMAFDQAISKLTRDMSGGNNGFQNWKYFVDWPKRKPLPSSETRKDNNNLATITDKFSSTFN